MIHLSDGRISRVITPHIAIQLAEEAFRAWGEGRARMPAKVYLTLPTGDFRAMPAYIRPSATPKRSSVDRGVIGVKWISVYPQNVQKGLPAVNGTLLLSDASNGRLKAVLDANVLTAWRTGAAGALATRLLAIKEAQTLLLVGAGVQSYYQVLCHARERKWSRILIWSPNAQQSRDLIRRLPSALRRLTSVAEELEAVVRSAHVICTCTPSTRPIFPSAWVRPGTHINAIGADAPGKQELDVALLKRSRIIVDDWIQASHSGEINVGHSAGRIRRSDIAADLGAVLTRKKRGRRSRQEITIFDSTGLAVQDMIMAEYAVRHA